MKRVDYIIVGFGIAGAALALELRRRKRSVIIFDAPYEHQASRVAAGLFNPITGKLMTRTWNADKLFPYLHKFYREAESLTNAQFFFPMPICIPFVSAKEQNNWMVKSGLEDFIDEVYTSSRYGDFIRDPFGGVILKSSGYVDTTTYLDATAKLFEIIPHNFNYDDLRIADDEIIYGSYHARAIIFCEGTGVRNNPFFKWAPVRPLKGETLQIQIGKTPPCIFNRGVYVVPAGKNNWRVGATYSHDVTEDVTEAGRKELMEKLSALFVPSILRTLPDDIGTSRHDIGTTHHTWGMRPTTPDRRPLLGSHPDHQNIMIFNGLGTKGVSLAPWSSGILSDYLTEGFQIKDELNISRFYALYSKFRD